MVGLVPFACGPRLYPGLVRAFRCRLCIALGEDGPPFSAEQIQHIRADATHNIRDIAHRQSNQRWSERPAAPRSRFRGLGVFASARLALGRRSSSGSR